MKTHSPFLIALAAIMTLALATPPGVPAQAARRAGQISRDIPEAAIARGPQQLRPS